MICRGSRMACVRRLLRCAPVTSTSRHRQPRRTGAFIAELKRTRWAAIAGFRCRRRCALPSTAFRAVNPAIGEWPLFPAPRAKEEHERGKIPKAWTRHYARALLERAECSAKLPKIDGGDFHPYRRKWATERKHLPDVDVAAPAAGPKRTRAP